MATSDATANCPYCGHVQRPFFHNRQSSCDGKVIWRRGQLVCARCERQMAKFNCDNCRTLLESSAIG